jgi:hypothetical protein
MVISGKRIIRSRQMYPLDIRLYKGKAIPLQAWTSPEVSRKLRLPVFKTFGT